MSTLNDSIVDPTPHYGAFLFCGMYENNYRAYEIVVNV